MTSTSATVNRALRAHVAPVLREAGFARIDARNGWRWVDKTVWVVNIRAVGKYFSDVTGWPPGSVRVWRGTSVCLVRPSGCNDEVVVYRIARARAADSLTVDARKIVHGVEQEMGVLTCRIASPQGPLTCAIPHGIWQFVVRKDSLVGELRLPDETKFRDARAVSVP